jgi:ribose transport system substrate-binding protein
MNWLRRLGMLGAVVLLAAACGGGGATTGSSGPKIYPIAFFAASSQNGFNAAVYQGAADEAQKLGNFPTQIFDGKFDATAQTNQVETIAAAKNFAGGIIVANDTVGIAPSVAKAITAGMKMCTALFPLGPDLTKLEPQVSGLTCTVANPPSVGAKAQADEVVKFCQDKNPCRVVELIGQLQFPFDKLRYDTWNADFKDHANIQLLATGQGSYDAGTSLKAMTDILQAHPQIDVLLSNADQHVEGAQIALKSHGYDLKALVGANKLFISGGGADIQAVQAIRNGEWNNTLAYYPYTMGKLAMDQLANALQGKSFQQVVNMDTAATLPPILTKAVLDANADFKGEWSG